ncbi:MAG: phthalate 4,5-dioxygenase [Deltaproteobacteria bacterium]|nr:phthalate 4,5-dioxygenase [Deltaproteobacteria bacterium]
MARQRIVQAVNATDNTLLGKDVAPTIEVEVSNFGLRIYTTRDAGADKRYLRVTNFVMPNLSAFGGSTVGDGYAVHWHVPIDDHSHWKYIFAFSRDKELDEFLRTRSRVELTADYRLGRNAANRYQQDRASIKTQTFTGMGTNFQVHDAFATESQGRVQNRTAENPVSSDKAIIAARKLILNAIKDVREGREPQHVIRDPQANRFANLVVLSDVIPKSTDWKEYTRSRELK